MNKKSSTGTIINKRASYDYQLQDVFLAGIVLSGAETRSLRSSHGSLNGSYVQIKNDEVWLINSLVTPLLTNSSNLPKEKQTRDRKLLLNKKEISKLVEAKNSGYTIVPTKFLTKGRYIKIEIATAKGKKKYDKREIIKQRYQDREARRITKGQY